MADFISSSTGRHFGTWSLIEAENGSFWTFYSRRCEVDVSNNGSAKELMSKGLGPAAMRKFKSSEDSIDAKWVRKRYHCGEKFQYPATLSFNRGTRPHIRQWFVKVQLLGNWCPFIIYQLVDKNSLLKWATMFLCICNFYRLKTCTQASQQPEETLRGTLWLSTQQSSVYWELNK